MTTKKIVRIALGVILTGLFLWLVFRQISLNEVKDIFSEVIPLWIFAAVCAFAVGYSCRIERWRLMLTLENPGLKWRSCAGPLMACVAANNIFPFRAGDLLRAFGFNKRLGISTGISISTLFVERLLDLLMIVIIFGIVLTYFDIEASRFTRVGGGFLLAGAVVILLALLFPTLFNPLAVGLVRLVSWASPRVGHVMHDELNRAMSALELMANCSAMLRYMLWSVLAWVSEGLVFLFAALSLPSVLHPTAAWLAIPLGTLATVIPSTPGYVGTFDFFTAQAMISLGNAGAASTAYALLVHILLWLPPTAVGGVYWLLHPIKSTDQLTRIQS